MGVTSIEWTDRSINPIRARNPATGAVGHYCEKVSSGCAHCYASTLQRRFNMPPFPGKPREPSTSIVANGTVRICGLDVFLDESKLEEVLRRRKPTKWFWCDMTDMFGSWVPTEWIFKCFDVMVQSGYERGHTHQVLTKRPARMAELTKRYVDCGHLCGAGGFCREVHGGHESLPPFIWLGTSVEDQRNADERIPHLLRCPAAVRFLSCEPLLGPIDLASAVVKRRLGDPQPNWVIVGGESGPGARPCNLAWVRSIVEQCKSAGVACFVKQLGSRPLATASLTTPNLSGGDGKNLIDWAINDSKGGDPSEWPEDLRVREFPKASVPC